MDFHIPQNSVVREVIVSWKSELFPLLAFFYLMC